MHRFTPNPMLAIAYRTPPHKNNYVWNHPPNKGAFSLYITLHIAIVGVYIYRTHCQTVHLRILVVVHTYVKYILQTMHNQKCTLYCLLLYLDYFLLYMYMEIRVLTESFFTAKDTHLCVKIKSDIECPVC